MLIVSPETKVLAINGTANTPDVLFDERQNTLHLWGVSMPENAKQFYAPIIHWMSENLGNTQKAAVRFRLEYFNTTSAKAILELILAVDKLYLSGNDVEIYWEYEAEDTELQEVGMEYSYLISCPVVLREH